MRSVAVSSMGGRTRSGQVRCVETRSNGRILRREFDLAAAACDCTRYTRDSFYVTSSAVVRRGLLGLVSLLAAVLCWTPQRTPHRCTRCTRWIDYTACPLLSTADCRLRKALQRYYLNVEECRFTRSSVRLAAANVVHYVPCWTASKKTREESV